MGSSGSEAVDFAVGSIVWVRRRNGSWWPGKILGPHDLSNNHLISPRSGTPVKLLGREDASVDWYNLEKSKRVKAFRCGDFDECIERAESSVGMPPKKREKYARREDAILHALELEKQMAIASGGKGSVTSSGNQEPVDDLNAHNSMDEGICASPVRGNGFHPMNKSKEAMTPEDEAPPKMRDLQEFGLQTIPSKRKFSSSFKEDEVDRNNNRFQAHTTIAGGYIIERNNHAKISDDRRVSPELLMAGTSARGYYRCAPVIQFPQNSANLSSFLVVDQAESHVDSHYVSAPNQIKDAYWAKRNRCMYLPSESNGYLSNISDLSPTLKQVSHFPLRDSKIPLNVSASDDNGSEFSEDTESNSSDSDDSETDSDEMDAITGRGDEHSVEGSEADGRLGNMSNEELDELTLASDIPLSADDGVSKWKLKGKRNIRHIRKRSSHIPNAGVRMNDQAYLETRGNASNNRVSRRSVNCRRNNDFDGYFEGDDSFDGDFWSPGSAHGNIRHPAPRHMPRGRSSNNNNHVYDWDGMALEHRTPLNGYLMESEDYYTSNQPYFSHGHVAGRRRNMLVEVDLKVQSSYPKQRAPIISMMSKIDGRAIIGHSLQIEEIAEGSSDALLSKRSEFNNRRLQREVEYPLPSGWKTARRTANYRVPRPDLSSAVDSGGDAEYFPLGRKSTSRDLNTSAMQKFDPYTYTIHHVQSLKPTRKFSKKANMSASQKTRTLSSFSVYNHKQRIGQGRHDMEEFSISELIKSESGSANVPCIPVKLVFSRLYEAVGRPPASIAPPNHEARVNTMTAGVQHQS